MIFRIPVWLFILAGLQACIQQESDIFKQITALQEQGDFSRAENLIKTHLEENRGLDSLIAQKLRFEIERGDRVRYDYRLTEDKLYDQIRSRLHDVSVEEFTEWQRQGWFDRLMIDGEKRFVNPSMSNLLFRHPEIKERLKENNSYSNLARVIDDHIKRLTKLSVDSPDPVVFPRKCMVKQTISVSTGKIPTGEIVRCWLPYPSIFDTQGEVRYIKSNQKPAWIASPGSPIRSVYFETKMPEDQPLQFAIEYAYTAYAFYQPIDPERILPFNGDEEIYQIYTKEEYPHEIFSEEMRRLSSELIGDEQNPYKKGKRIYDWIADNIRYSYAREYSTLRNISAYCLENRYGDCGQEAILFITLCRIAGIPARWQSGFMTFPGDVGMHDWAEIYIKPYGWLPVDPYMGIFFTSVTEDLDPHTRRELRDFYYGNIDHFRLVANKGHNQILYPAKKDFRSETVDFQRGEVEWAGRNLYFDKWGWSVNVTEIGEE